MKHARRFITRIAVALFLVVLVGCIAGNSPRVTYHRLLPIENTGEQGLVTAGDNLVVGVGPISVPDYLKKAQIATRVGSSRYEFNDFHRWAGIIEEDIANVIRANIATLLATDNVMLFPWRQYFKPEYRVEIDISQFDCALDTEAFLNVQWTITDMSGKNILASGYDSYSRTMTASSYDELIVAESALLADLSRDISEKILKLVGQ